MALIDITPVMTSNTTPEPYVVSNSDSFSNIQNAYAIFTPTGNSAWALANVVGWIQIDLGAPKKISQIKILPRTDFPLCTPKVFIIEGSNDNINFTAISPKFNKSSWDGEELVHVNYSQQYRYIRLNIESNLGWSQSSIARIKLEYDTELDKTVSHTYAFHAQTLAMNTTANIYAKSNDPREGLLGMANDGENYGDLYVVGPEGRAHLAKSGMKSEVIFEGKVGIGDITIAKPYDNFKQLIFYISNDGFGFTDYSCVSVVIDTSTIKENFNNLASVGQYAFVVSAGGAIELSFTGKRTIKNLRLINNNTQIFIKKITGVY